MGYVYRFLDMYENILYVGSCSNFKNRMMQHYKNGHLKDEWYDKVYSIEYAKFNSRAEAYMFETYEIATINPPYNRVGKENKNIELQYFKIIDLPSWNVVTVDYIKKFYL